MRSLFFIFFLAFLLPVYAQQETSRWFFGKYAGLDFRPGYVVADIRNSVMDVEGGSASMADSEGNLLFFTNGQTMWNQEFGVMVNGDELAGHPHATQSSIIVPQPGPEPVYLVFTLDRVPPAGNRGLHYSVVDMRLDNGLGAVTSKNSSLLQPASEQLTATRHANGKDIWVIVHGWDSDSFYAFLVTNMGVDPVPVISQTGLLQGGSAEGTRIGNMKISPDGKKIALAHYGRNLFEFFSFDASRGIVSNPRQSFTNFRGAFGVEFSPDSRKVYGSTYLSDNGFAQSYIFQFDAMAPHVGETGIPIPTSVDAPFRACAMQMGPDGRIYVSRYGDESMGVILFPNRDSAKCDYIENWISLEGRQSRAGLPNFLQSFLKIPPLSHYGHCAGNDIFFQLVNPGPVDSVVWDFNDKSSGEQNVSRLVNPVHVFSQPGTYTIRVLLYHKGTLYRNSWDVQVNPVPDIYLGGDRILFPGAHIILDAGEGFTSYLWQDSSQQQTFFVDHEGTYSVLVSNEHNCLNIDQISVYYLPLTVPNAFTPNNDGINDEFRPIMPVEGIRNYRLTIFDRWGGIVCQLNHPLQSWDGTYRGTPCPHGQYVWHLVFDARKELNEFRQVEKQGIIQLLR